MSQTLADRLADLKRATRATRSPSALAAGENATASPTGVESDLVTRRAVILAHNYQRPEVQDAADFVGDSLDLSRKAAATDAQVILFCGVHFMAETAAVLCPGRTILAPDLNAGCPMADMITPGDLLKLKEAHPDAIVVAYINTTAAVKAESDICCTSANAVAVLKSLGREREIIFIPDKNLADYASREAGVPVVAWPGYCPTHARILPEDIARARAQHPQAKLLVHPECRRDVIELADKVASTSGMVRFSSENNAREFILATEPGLLHRLRKENPGKAFYPASERADCPNMKLNTIEKMVWALEEMKPQVSVPPDVADRARRAIERMLEIA